MSRFLKASLCAAFVIIASSAMPSTAGLAPPDGSACQFYGADGVVLPGAYLNGNCQPYHVETMANDRSGNSSGDIGCSGCTTLQVNTWISECRASGNVLQKCDTDAGTGSWYLAQTVETQYLNPSDSHNIDPLVGGPPIFDTAGCTTGILSTAVQGAVNFGNQIAAVSPFGDPTYLHLPISAGGHNPPTTADRFYQSSGAGDTCNVINSSSASETLTAGAKAPITGLASTTNVQVGQPLIVSCTTGTGCPATEGANTVGSFTSTTITPASNWSLTLGPATFTTNVTNTPPLYFFNMASPTVVSYYNTLVQGACLNPTSGIFNGLGFNCPSAWNCNVKLWLLDQEHWTFAADTANPSAPTNFTGAVITSLEYPDDVTYNQARWTFTKGVQQTCTVTRFQFNGASNNMTAVPIEQNMTTIYATPFMQQQNSEQCPKGFIGNGSSTRYPDLTTFASCLNTIINSNQIFQKGIGIQNTSNSAGSDTAAQTLAVRMASAAEYLMCPDWRNTSRENFDTANQTTMEVYAPLGVLTPYVGAAPAHPCTPYNQNGSTAQNGATTGDGSTGGAKSVEITDASNGGHGNDPRGNDNGTFGQELQMAQISHVTFGVPDQVALVPGTWVAIVVNATNAAVTVPCGGGHYLSHAYDHSFTPADVAAGAMDVLDMKVNNAGVNIFAATTTQAVTFAEMFNEALFTCGTTPVPANSTMFLKIG